MWKFADKLRRRGQSQAVDHDASGVPFGGLLTDALYDAMRAEVERKLREGADPDELAVKVQSFDYSALLDETSEGIYRALRRNLRRHIDHLATGDKELSRRMAEVWGDADDFYRAVSYAAYEIGAAIAEAPGTPGPRLTAMLGVHARAVRVSGEVRLLAMNGFDTGATARWRSLHDLAVVCAVLANASEEVSVRYNAYAYIEAYKDLKVYQEHAPKLGYQPFTDDEVAIAKANYDAVRRDLGRDMSNENGWAFLLFPDAKRVVFADLETLAGLGHLRPFYKLGNNFVHAGPRGTDLNSPDHPTLGTRAHNVGATVFGDIAETCHGAMNSIHQATASLVRAYLAQQSDGGVDLLVGLKAQSKFVADGGDAWGAAADVARARGWFSHTPSRETE